MAVAQTAKDSDVRRKLSLTLCTKSLEKTLRSPTGLAALRQHVIATYSTAEQHTIQQDRLLFIDNLAELSHLSEKLADDKVSVNEKFHAAKVFGDAQANQNRGKIKITARQITALQDSAPDRSDRWWWDRWYSKLCVAELQRVVKTVLGKNTANGSTLYDDSQVFSNMDVDTVVKNYCQ